MITHQIPGCQGICRSVCDSRPLDPRKAKQCIKDGYQKCTNCLIWIKVDDKYCPCCKERLRVRSKVKHKPRIE